MSAKLFRLALTEDEARSLEVELDVIVRKLKERTAGAPSMGADQLIARYAAIIAKIRKARGLDKPDPRRRARDGALS